jgi:pyruvate formate lyase activating enzyme
MDAETETCVDVEYWTRLVDGRIECNVCPRFCRMRPGQRGLCFVRRARDDGGGMELTGYGRSTGFCVDPIEKKPLNHFLPGSAVLSFGTAGCNLACSFCQNWGHLEEPRSGAPKRVSRAGDNRARSRAAGLR